MQIKGKKEFSIFQKKKNQSCVCPHAFCLPPPLMRLYLRVCWEILVPPSSEWLHTGRTIPSAEVVCCSCWVWKMLVFFLHFFFEHSLVFSSVKTHLSLFVVYWLIKRTRCIYTQGPDAKCWPPVRSNAMGHGVLLRKGCDVDSLSPWQPLGGQSLPANTVVIYFHCSPISHFRFGAKNVTETFELKGIKHTLNPSVPQRWSPLT